MVPEHFSYTYDRKILLQTSKRTFFACFLNRKFCVFNRKCHVFNRKFCVPFFHSLFFDNKFYVFDSKFHVFESKFQILYSKSGPVDAKYR